MLKYVWRGHGFNAVAIHPLRHKIPVREIWLFWSALRVARYFKHKVVISIVIKYVLATWILENPKFADEIGARRIQPHDTNLDFKYFVW